MIDGQGRAFIRCNSHVLQSELSERLLKNDPDAVYADIWYEHRGARIHSLRSRREDEDVNVSAIAKSYGGGGGHRCSAGYREDTAGELAAAVKVIEFYATIPQDTGREAKAFLERRASKHASENQMSSAERRP